MLKVIHLVNIGMLVISSIGFSAVARSEDNRGVLPLHISDLSRESQDIVMAQLLSLVGEMPYDDAQLAKIDTVSERKKFIDESGLRRQYRAGYVYGWMSSLLPCLKIFEPFAVFVRSSGYEHETRKFIVPSRDAAARGTVDPQRI